MAGGNRQYDLNNFAHREPLDELNPLHEWVHECKRRRIDLKALVTEVRLTPRATTEPQSQAPSDQCGDVCIRGPMRGGDSIRSIAHDARNCLDPSGNCRHAW